jgi:hypothetical protein
MSVEMFARIAAMEESRRRSVLRQLIWTEYGDPAQSRRLAAERLHAWATLARSDLEGARRLGKSYDEPFAELPAEVAMRRATVVQSVVSAEFTDEERVLLLEVVPGMGRHIPLRTHAVATKAAPKVQERVTVRRRGSWRLLGR